MAEDKFGLTLLPEPRKVPHQYTCKGCQDDFTCAIHEPPCEFCIMCRKRMLQVME